MGWLIYLNNALVGWNSKVMSGVTLSSTEAEYVSMLEGLKDLKFIYMSLKYLKMKVNLPMILLINNIGVIVKNSRAKVFLLHSLCIWTYLGRFSTLTVILFYNYYLI